MIQHKFNEKWLTEALAERGIKYAPVRLRAGPGKPKELQTFSNQDEETRGLVVRQKTHDREVLGSNPRWGDHFSCTIHLDQIMETKKKFSNQDEEIGHVTLNYIILFEKLEKREN